MKPDLFIGIDSSTTATKVIAWDSVGRSIAQSSCSIPLSSPKSCWYEQDPENWWSSAVKALRDLLQQVDKERIAAIAVANQRETFAALDSKGDPVRPAIIWLDERCREQVDKFAQLFGDENLHRITGKPKDYAPVVYRLAWMKEHEPELYKKASVFSDVQAYLVNKLTGSIKTSWASADPMGIFDLERKEWSQEILKQLDITPDKLPVAACPGTLLGYVTEASARLTGLRAGTPVAAGGGDGQSAGLGVNALTPSRAYLNLGTAVVSGSFIQNYIVDKAFRTMAACSDEGYYCETSLRSGSFLIDWFLNKVVKADLPGQTEIYEIMEEEAGRTEAGSEGLFVLPYWNAVMNPYWDPDARGCIIGLSSGHGRGHIYRAILEGIAMEQTLATDLVEKAAGINIEEFAVIGGGAKSSLWRQIISDTSGRKVLQMATAEASALGAGISAAVMAGRFSSFKQAADSMTHVISETHPNPENAKRYRELLQIYRDIYPNIRGIFRKISSLNQCSGS